MSSPKLWRGQTLQDRSIDRREQMLAAGAQLLGEGGVAAVTMRAIVREADLSPRYFYESFGSREDLIRAVYDRTENELIERLGAADVSAGLHAAVRSVFEICAEYFDEDPRRARILLREPLADDVLRRHSADRVPAFLRAVIPMLGEPAERMLPVGEEELSIAATALSGALVALYLDWIDGRLAVGRERLAESAVAVVFALAAAAPPGDNSSTPPQQVSTGGDASSAASQSPPP
ncbi:TetR/AcrR family transcriptional regulator [Nocardia otitidiscaviarum]|uniref:TetR/AcrR family transcriptional regulator n=1 Tax=Nocardia otitidiscaviarum TaxID=1823 RepID=UPI001895B2C1|nr:TetR/AcrR family transcriptional regulator [Nocardia otitidiscaviarum]MBF6236513.1 TetR/AcrR family transcriptional regulator [Nocardia otitidiscaviarum]